MMKKITKTNSTLKTLARLLLAIMLVVAQAATIATPVLAAETTVSNTSTVTVDGVKYTTLLKQGQVQLTVGDKVLLLSKENTMAAATLDRNGTVWVISYSGRCSGYNYALQKNEPSVNLHMYLNNAESFVLDSNNLGVEIQTTTGKVTLPNLEEFKKLAGITSSNNNSSTGSSTGNNNSTGNSTGNNSSTSTGNNTTTNTTGSLNLVETKKVGSTQYTFIVTNGKAQVLINDKIISLPESNVAEIGVDANGTIIVIVNNNGTKEARWYNPSLQTKEVKTNLLANNVNCLIKDSNGVVTSVVANSTVVKLLTVEEQKKALGIVETTTTTKVNEERVTKMGDYTYVVLNSSGKKITSYKFKDNIVTWRGVKYKNVKRVCVIQKSKNLVLTSNSGSVVTVNYDTMKRKTVFKATESKGRATRYTYNSRGFATGFITSKGAKISLKKF